MDDSQNLKTELKEIHSRLNSIDQTLSAQHEQLRLHIYRTELLEKSTEKLGNVLDLMVKTDIQPLKRHVYMVEGGLKVMGAIGSIVLVAAGIFKILEFFK